MTQDHLADSLGVTRGNVSACENGRHDPSWSQILKISDLTGCALPFQNKMGTVDKRNAAYGRYITIIGDAHGDADGYIAIDDDTGAGRQPIYSSSADGKAYAICVRGDSMRPRIKSGEYIVAEPGTYAQPGDDVVVKRKDGRSLIKELMWTRDGEVSLGSINDGMAPITIPLKEIDSIHRIAAVIPRGSAVLK